MATVFSTATLNLNADTRQFNRDMSKSAVVAQKAFDSMSQSAKAFEANWKDLTHGIKDTRRIISGILISQGFYAVSGALVNTASAALDFSMSMETAAVSLEYFVDSAAGSVEAATKVQAYLREVKDFAARTPFNTDQVLTLSKYMQAVGVSMNQTQSVLSVITDTAAATGAGTEQLQRITFALGQMITKGRIANEEIRQLANANIPIYDILQEELHLTGEEISNIGKHWVDADKAVVAILHGLEKRYKGAADRIAETLTGMTDTIIDDTKIIANEALDGLYNKITEKAATLRDTLDEWREIATQRGAPGLFNDVTLQLDPTGQLGNSILHTVGHLLNLKETIIDLYHTAQPLLSTLGQAFAAASNVGIATLTAFAEVINLAAKGLDKLGLSSGVASKSIASLIVAYKATKMMSMLGQAAAEAGMSMYQLYQSFQSLLPAAMNAHLGLTTVTAGLVGLITYGLTAIGVFNALQSSFSGLSNENGLSGMSVSWEKAFNDYERQLDEYNKAIEAQRDDFRQGYESIDDKKDNKPAAEKDTQHKKGKGGSGKDTWLASFDEVYVVPDKSTAAYQDAVKEDLGRLIKQIGAFKFPKLSSGTLVEPKFELDKVYGDDVWNNDLAAGAPFWRATLPVALLGLATGIGRVFAKQIKPSISGKVVKEADISSMKPAEVRQVYESHLHKQQAIETTLDSMYTRLNSLVKQASIDTRPTITSDIESTLVAIDENKKELAKTNKVMQQAAGQLGEHATSLKHSADNEALAIKANSIVLKRRAADLRHAIDTAPDLETKARYVEELKKITDSTTENLDDNIKLLGESLVDKAARVERNAENIYELSKKYTKAPYSTGDGKHPIYDEETFGEITHLTKENNKLIAELRQQLGKDADELIPKGVALHNIMYSLKDNYTKYFNESLETMHRYNLLATDTNRLLAAGAQPDRQALIDIQEPLRKVDEAVTLLNSTLERRPETLDEAEKKHAEETARWRIQAERRASLLEQQKKVMQAEKEAAEAIRLKETTEAVANKHTADLQAASESASIADFVKDITEDRKTLSTLQKEQTEVLQSIEAVVNSDVADKDDILRNLYAKQDDLERRIDDLAGIDAAHVKPVKSLPIALSAEQQKTLDTVTAFLHEAIDNADELAAINQEGINRWFKKFSTQQRNQLAAFGLQPKSLMVPASNISAAIRGIDDNGKTLLQYITESAHKPVPGFIDGGLSTAQQHAVDRGRIISKYIGPSLDSKLLPHSMNLFNGLTAFSDTSGIVSKIDYVLSGKGINKIWPDVHGPVGVNVQTVNADFLRGIENSSKKIADGVYVANGTILKGLNHTDNFFKQMVQSQLMTGAAGKQAAVFFNADYDFSKTLPNFSRQYAEQLVRVFNNSAASIDTIMENVGGRIFSDDAFSMAQKLSSLGKKYTWEMYDADVVAPLFKSMDNDFDFKALADNIDVAFLDFSGALKNYTPEKYAAAYRKAVLEVAGNDASSDIKPIMSVLGYGKKPLVGTIPYGPSLKNVPNATRSINEWAQAILRDDSVEIAHGAVSKAFAQKLDKLTADYLVNLSKGVPDAADLFTSSITNLHGNVQKLLNGEQLNKDIAKIFGRMADKPIKYYDSLRVIDAALEKLENTPNDFNKLASNLNSYSNQLRRLREKAATGVNIETRHMRSLVESFSSVADTMGLYTNPLALNIGDRLQQLLTATEQAPSYIAIKRRKAVNPDADVSDITPGRAFSVRDLDGLDLPIHFANANELVGLLHNDAATNKLDNIIDLIADKNAVPDGAHVIIADLETAGLHKVVEGLDGAWSVKDPYIIQASFKDTDTNKVLDYFIKTGNKAIDNQNFKTIQAILSSQGDSLSDVAKAFKDMSFEDYYAKAVTKEDLWQLLRANFGEGNVLVGYNATGVNGFDYNILKHAGMPADLFTPGKDIMKRVQELLFETTGKSDLMHLSTIFEMISSKSALGAHHADEDVLMTEEVMHALDDGRLKNVFEVYAEQYADTALNLEDGLKEAAENIRAANATAAGNVADELKEAAAYSFKISSSDEAAKAIGSELGGIAEKAVKQATFKESLEQAAKRFASDAADFMKKVTKPFTSINIFTGIKEKLEGTKFNHIFNVLSPKSFTQLTDDWLIAAQAVDTAQEALDKAVKASADKLTLSALEKQLDRAIAKCDTASNELFESMIRGANNTLNGTEAVESSFKNYIRASFTTESVAKEAAEKAAKKATDVFAFYYTKDSKGSSLLKTVGDAATIKPAELINTLAHSAYFAENIEKSVQTFFENMKEGIIAAGDNADAIAAVINVGMKQVDRLIDVAGITKTDSLTAALEAIRNIALDPVAVKGSFDEAAKIVNEALQGALENSSDDAADLFAKFAQVWRKEFKGSKDEAAEAVEQVTKILGDNLVVIDAASGELKFAGEAAQGAIKESAQNIASGLDNFVDTLLTKTVAGVSFLDLVGLGADIYTGSKENKAAAAGATAKTLSGLSAESAKALHSIDGNLDKLLGGEVFKGLGETTITALGEMFLTNGAAAIASSATKAAVTAHLAGTGAAAAGAAGLVAGAPVVLAGILASILAGGAYHAVNHALGGDSVAYKHSDEYMHAVETGQFVDVPGLIAALESKGYAREDAERIANEANDRQHRVDSQQIYGGLRKNKVLENDYIYDALYGQKLASKTLRTDESATLRLGAALGVLDVDMLDVRGVQGAGVNNGRDLMIRTEDKDVASRELMKISHLLGRADLHLQKYSNGYRVVDSNNKGIATDFSNLSQLADVVDMITTTGASTGDLPSEIMQLIQGNNVLLAAYEKDNPRAIMLEYLPQLIDAYNHANGTNYTQRELEEAGVTELLLNQAAELFTQQMGVLNTINEKLVSSSQANATSLRTEGNTETLLAGVDLTNIPGTLTESLKELGITLSTSTEETPSGGKLPFTSVATDATTLLENMKGFRLDATVPASSAFANLSTLQVTAQDAEILAQAGIRVNGDGTFDFMMSHMDDVAGSERKMTLTKKDFSEGILSQLGTYNMKVNFDVGELDLGNFETIKEKMTSALFSMSDSIHGTLNSDAQSIIDSLGHLTNDGFLEITNTAILNGERSMSDLLDSFDWTNVTGKMREQLYTIATVIDEGGETARESIIKWANGVVVPSPIDASLLTEDIKKNFAQIGVAFVEGANGLQMVISNTGEDLTNGVSLIDKEKWLAIDQDIRKHLNDIGVHATERGNEMLIDITEVIEKGAEGIVAIFTEKPELWDQLPDALKQTFAKAGIVSEEGMLVIKNAVSKGVAEIGDNWIVSIGALPELATADMSALANAMDLGLVEITQAVEGAQVGQCIDGGIVQPIRDLPDEALQNMDLTKINLDTGLVLIKQAVEGAAVGQTIDGSVVVPFNTLGTKVGAALTNTTLSAGTGMYAISKAVMDGNVATAVHGGIIVPFDDLPPELKEALGNAATELEGQYVELYDATEFAGNGVIDALSATQSDASAAAAAIGETVRQAFSMALSMNNIDVSPAWRHDWNNTWKKNRDGTYQIRAQDQDGQYLKFDSVAGANIYEAIEAVNTRNGLKLKANSDGTITVQEKANGGIVDGSMPVLAGERGVEMAVLPDGTTQMLSRGLYHLPTGSEILTAQDTAAVRHFAGDRPKLKAYAAGTANASSFVPANAQLLRFATGMPNAGIIAEGSAGTRSTSITDCPVEVINKLADGIASKMYMYLAPLFATMTEAEQSRTMAYVGTLIADDDGLRELERSLGEIRVQEGRRR